MEVCERFITRDFRRCVATTQFLRCSKELLLNVLRGGDVDYDFAEMMTSIHLWGSSSSLLVSHEVAVVSHARTLLYCQ